MMLTDEVLGLVLVVLGAVALLAFVIILCMVIKILEEDFKNEK